MDFFPLISIPILFVLFALIKSRRQTWLHWNVCSVCASVSLTWIIMLVLVWQDVIDTMTPVAILMGMSVTGLMSKLTTAYQARNLRLLWLARLVIILGGYVIIMALLAKNWPVLFLTILAVGILLIVVSFLLQGITHGDALASAPKGIRKSLLKKLDNCC